MKEIYDKNNFFIDFLPFFRPLIRNWKNSKCNNVGILEAVNCDLVFFCLQGKTDSCSKYFSNAVKALIIQLISSILIDQ